MPPQKGLVLSLFLFLNYIALPRSCDVDCCSDCRPNQGSYVNKNKDVKISQKFTSYQDHKEDSKEKDSKHR